MFTTAQQFTPQGRILDVRPYGNGNVHDTYLVTVQDSGKERRFILQRLNTRVFRQPELVMRNLCTCTAHLDRRLRGAPLAAGRRWETPRLLPAGDGGDLFLGPEGSCWRALSFIEAAQSFETIQNLGHAREVGQALGRFHLPPERPARRPPGRHPAGVSRDPGLSGALR